MEEWSTPADWLFNKLNYTSLAYLTSIEDPLKRAFYEQETIRGCWTVRELDRQVSSQYYERMGLSKDKKALQKLAVSKYRLQLPSEDDIKQRKMRSNESPTIFENNGSAVWQAHLFFGWNRGLVPVPKDLSFSEKYLENLNIITIFAAKRK